MLDSDASLESEPEFGEGNIEGMISSSSSSSFGIGVWPTPCRDKINLVTMFRITEILKIIIKA